MSLITGPIDALKTMLSKCYALQHWQGATYSEIQLLARIYEDSIPDPANNSTHTLDELNAIRPFILVGVDSDDALSIERDGSTAPWFKSNGTLQMLLEQNVLDATPTSLIDRTFTQTVESMLRTGNVSQPGLAELVDTAGALQISSIQAMGPYRVDIEEAVSKGDCQRFYLRIKWGL